MGALDVLESNVGSLAGDISSFVASNPIAATAIGAGSATVLAAGTALVVGSKTSTTGKKKKSKTKRGRSRDRKFISKQKWEVRRKRKTPGKIYKKKGKYLSRKPLRRAGKKKSRRFVKGSKEAKSYMAKIRRMRK